MKKLIICLFAFVLLISIAGCGASPSELPETESSVIPQSPSPEIVIESEGVGDGNEYFGRTAEAFIEEVNKNLEEIGSGLRIDSFEWDSLTYCTDAKVTPDIELWLFSLEEDSNISEIALDATYPKNEADMNYFSAELGLTAAAVIVAVDPSYSPNEAAQMFMSLVSELSNGNESYIEYEKNEIHYTIFQEPHRVSLSITLY